MEDLTKLDLMQLTRRAISLHNPNEKLQLDFLSEYITITTDGDSLQNPSVDLDVNKAFFSGETESSVTFTDLDKQVFNYPSSDYGKKWIVLNQKGILGSLVTKAYDDLIKAIKNQVPHHLRDQVK